MAGPRSSSCDDASASSRAAWPRRWRCQSAGRAAAISPNASVPAIVVIGERRRPRQQIADRCGDRAAPGERRLRAAGRRRATAGSIACEASVVRRAQRAVRDRDRDLGVRQRAVEQRARVRRPPPVSARRRDARAGAVDAEMARQRAGVSRLLQPADVEAFAEAPQVDAVDLAVSGVTHRLRRACRSNPTVPSPTVAPRNSDGAKVGAAGR